MGILQARILEWVAMPSSMGSSQPRDRTQFSRLQEDSLPAEPPGKPREGLKRPKTQMTNPFQKATPCLLIPCWLLENWLPHVHTQDLQKPQGAKTWSSLAESAGGLLYLFPGRGLSNPRLTAPSAVIFQKRCLGIETETARGFWSGAKKQMTREEIQN